LTGAECFAIGQIERGEKRGVAVPFIVVGLGASSLVLLQGDDALTYVAAFVSSLGQLLHLLFMLSGGRCND